MGTANTYVFVRTGKVIAYYSLSAHRIQSSELPTSLAHGSPRSVPAYLIGKLAVTRTEQGQSVGQSILTDAFLRICRATDSGAGARFIAVDAIDDTAMKFYAQEHFHSSPDDPHQMFIKVSTALKIVTRG
jgi:predicted GNAT family N-acyltransferase